MNVLSRSVLLPRAFQIPTHVQMVSNLSSKIDPRIGGGKPTSGTNTVTVTQANRQQIKQSQEPTAEQPLTNWLNEFRKSPQGDPELAGNVTMSDLTVRQKRALYRSKQRGWLELDVILGRWTTKNIGEILGGTHGASQGMHLLNTEEGMSQLEKILDAETPDLFKWVTRQAEPPEEIRGKVLDSIQEFVFSQGGAVGSKSSS